VTPEAEAVLHYEIGQILRGFYVSLHYVASATSDYGVRYAVFDKRASPSRQVSDPAPHLQAKADLARLQTEAILQLIKELSADVRAAD
jgi:hypothetical protein